MQSNVSPVVALRLRSVSDQGRATAQHVPYGTSRLVLLCTKGMPESCTLHPRNRGDRARGVLETEALPARAGRQEVRWLL